MTRFALPPALACLCIALFGCDPGTDADDGSSPTTNEPGTGTSGADDDGSSDDADPDPDDTAGDDMADDESGSTGGGPTGVWMEIAGPCGGSATNALWFDDADVGFVGCGENAAGEGLFTTIDAGATWEDNPQFNEVRVMDIRRGPDGVLRGAGIHQLDGYSVFDIDEDGALTPEGLYEPGNNAFTTVNQAENVATTEDGQILIDSLTGTSAAYQPAGGVFEEFASLGEAAIADPDNAPAFQVRRIVGFDNAFYAVGSLINDPARVHLPSMMEGATYHFTTLQLQSDTRDGELLDMHVWAGDKMIVAGHDQSQRYPLIYVAAGDAYNADNWTQITLLDFGIEYEGGINDLHVVGDTVIAVGEKFPSSQGGFVLRSDDAGLTWEDISPEDVGVLSAVWQFDDGSMLVGGGGGEMWVMQ
ncbi:MAG: hypothetical protein AAF721_37730 [Myxococcota bacterium]